MTEHKELMTPGEVAALMKVDPKTVTRWAHSGLIRSIRTPGGHHRFYRSDVDAIVNGETHA
jgi:excisionase family DNA binding protein